MTNQYLFGPENAHRRAAEGRVPVESTRRHRTEMKALGQAIDSDTNRQLPIIRNWAVVLYWRSDILEVMWTVSWSNMLLNHDLGN